MMRWGSLDVNTFLSEYWQKKPLVIRQALPDFVAKITADELAGLAMEEDIESRLVIATPDRQPYWQLRQGPFLERDFQQLPPTHWTLLVQGVDRILPELAALFESFNFVPQWLVDDLMISYAVKQGSVGPHYDNYNVFLFQAQGQREWSLTTKRCDEENHIPHIPLRLMRTFDTEATYLLEEGDLLYLPPHVGHYGIAVSDECMTYSFGYRNFTDQELWDSFGDYVAEQQIKKHLYQTPVWKSSHGSSELPPESWLKAQRLLREMIDDEATVKAWFGCFVTQLDRPAADLLPEPLIEPLEAFTQELAVSTMIVRHSCCRFAYQLSPDTSAITLFINGCTWTIDGVDLGLIGCVANQRMFTKASVSSYLNRQQNILFLFELWKLQWIELSLDELV